MVIKLRPVIVGKYIEQSVFVGRDRAHLQHAGMLRLHVGEYQLFGTALKLGADQTKGAMTVIVDPPALTEEAFMEQVERARIE